MSDFSGFYKLTLEERWRLLQKYASLSDEEMKLLKAESSLGIQMADRMIENVISTHHLPIGLATNFVINGKEHVIPMSIEEPSVIAAACKAAKLTLPEGFTAKSDEPVMIGQIQIIKPEKNAAETLGLYKKEILEIAKSHAKMIERYGGGVRDFKVREIKTLRGEMLIVDFYIDVRDAMGANTVNTVLEGVAPTIAHYSGGKARLKIISNLATGRKVYARAVWKKEVIGEEGVEGVLDAYAFAAADIYRCSTHNKGIMNGIDAVAIATGNDWRAIEAGAHAYASLNGYTPLTHYEKDKKGNLAASIEMPLAAATIGGAINSLHTAKISLKIVKVASAQELAQVMACVGLANNFAALYALSTEGIQKGHMKLHARNMAVLAGASSPEEIDFVAKKLAEKKEYSVDYAKEILKKKKNNE